MKDHISSVVQECGSCFGFYAVTKAGYKKFFSFLDDEPSEELSRTGVEFVMIKTLVFTMFYHTWWEENIYFPRIENEAKRSQSGYCSAQGTPSHLELGCSSLAIFSDAQIIRSLFPKTPNN